jgi:hypothetical protein
VKPSGSLSVTTTDALFAGKVQRKVRNGVAGFAAAGSSLDRAENRGNSCHLSHAPRDKARTSVSAEILALSRAAYPQHRSSHANSLRGEIRPDSRKSVRPFKGKICTDISKFCARNAGPGRCRRMTMIRFF